MRGRWIWRPHVPLTSRVVCRVNWKRLAETYVFTAHPPAPFTAHVLSTAHLLPLNLRITLGYRGVPFLATPRPLWPGAGMPAVAAAPRALAALARRGGGLTTRGGGPTRRKSCGARAILARSPASPLLAKSCDTWLRDGTAAAPGTLDACSRLSQLGAYKRWSVWSINTGCSGRALCEAQAALDRGGRGASPAGSGCDDGPGHAWP
mmetsp:Transcript_36943/g.118849  ORF Transcript_36943/g.118849 Transcript_36943/m.118849 type:complete len:206 (-) Transcript_36943:530-1147(-)